MKKYKNTTKKLLIRVATLELIFECILVFIMRREKYKNVKINNKKRKNI
jgi:hypothetical protein